MWTRELLYGRALCAGCAPGRHPGAGDRGPLGVHLRHGTHGPRGLDRRGQHPGGQRHRGRLRVHPRAGPVLQAGHHGRVPGLRRDPGRRVEHLPLSSRRHGRQRGRSAAAGRPGLQQRRRSPGLRDGHGNGRALADRGAAARGAVVPGALGLRRGACHGARRAPPPARGHGPRADRPDGGHRPALHGLRDLPLDVHLPGQRGHAPGAGRLHGSTPGRRPTPRRPTPRRPTRRTIPGTVPHRHPRGCPGRRRPFCVCHHRVAPTGRRGAPGGPPHGARSRRVVRADGGLPRGTVRLRRPLQHGAVRRGRARQRPPGQRTGSHRAHARREVVRRGGGHPGRRHGGPRAVQLRGRRRCVLPPGHGRRPRAAPRADRGRPGGHGGVSPGRHGRQCRRRGSPGGHHLRRHGWHRGWHRGWPRGRCRGRLRPGP